jgi:replicative DNA helicase
VRPGGTTKSQNRNDELSEICRTLKATAKDLQIPIVALAQLNRGVESRNDKRPMLSDLRDCLAGDSMVMNADTGQRVAIADIVNGSQRFNVWALDDTLKLVRRPIVDAWAVGEKQLFRVTTNSGRTIRCTQGHRFRSVAGWRTLRELALGATIAVPRRYDAPEPAAAPMSEGRALLLGWLLGDGHLGGSPAVTVAVDLESLAFSDVLWDSIASIEACGSDMTYDLTVGDLHNFCVDDFITHNSGAIEQEADMVTFLYRDSYYNPESAVEDDLTEFIIAKNRSGPTGTVKLRFKKEYTLFLSYGDRSHFPGP